MNVTGKKKKKKKRRTKGLLVIVGFWRPVNHIGSPQDQSHIENSFILVQNASR